MVAAARSQSLDRRFYGIFEGIVTHVGDDLQEGMVKVNLPWLDGHTTSEWSPVMQFFAGPDHGAFFIPEVDSLVLCMARHGDLRRLVIVGGLYNGVDKPPVDHERRRHLRTPSGQTLGFIDANDNTAGAVYLESSAGDRIMLTSGGTVHLKAMGTLILEGSQVVLRGPGWERLVAMNRNTV